MSALTFKQLLAGFYNTDECLRGDSRLLCAMRDLGWFAFSPPYAKRNKNFPYDTTAPEWFKSGDKEWKKDIRAALKKLNR